MKRGWDFLSLFSDWLNVFLLGKREAFAVPLEQVNVVETSGNKGLFLR